MFIFCPTLTSTKSLVLCTLGEGEWVSEASQIHLPLDGVAETFKASGVTICLTVKMCATSF